MQPFRSVFWLFIIIGISSHNVFASDELAFLKGDPKKEGKHKKLIQSPTLQVIENIGVWLDPQLQKSQDQVIEIILNQETVPVTCSNSQQEMGFSFMPGFNAVMYLEIIRNRSKEEGKRIPVVNLGCGIGQSDVLMVFAGGQVDMVDSELLAITTANRYVFKSTHKLLGFEKKTAHNYYRATHQDIVSDEATWHLTKHQIGICESVIHFLSPDGCFVLAKRLYENLENGGIAFITADSPSYDLASVVSYEIGKALGSMCPGFAVYPKSIKTNKLVGSPIPVSREAAQPKEGTYHVVRNLFKAEDLGAIFTKAGFTLSKMYYINSFGDLIQDSQREAITDFDKIPIGEFARACVILTKK